jgi:hypothetical protein
MRIETQTCLSDNIKGVNIDDDYNIIRKKVEYSVEYNKRHPMLVEKMEAYKQEVKEIIKETYENNSEMYRNHKDIVMKNSNKVNEKINELDEKFSEQLQAGNSIGFFFNQGNTCGFSRS